MFSVVVELEKHRSVESREKQGQLDRLREVLSFDMCMFVVFMDVIFSSLRCFLAVHLWQDVNSGDVEEGAG